MLIFVLYYLSRGGSLLVLTHIRNHLIQPSHNTSRCDCLEDTSMGITETGKFFNISTYVIKINVKKKTSNTIYLQRYHKILCILLFWLPRRKMFLKETGRLSLLNSSSENSSWVAANVTLLVEYVNRNTDLEQVCREGLLPILFLHLLTCFRTLTQKLINSRPTFLLGKVYFKTRCQIIIIITATLHFKSIKYLSI